jgi:GrpB-like predicted nucleotidyltransferase (UPF0157 family)
MPPPFKVELLAHDPQWASKAADESRELEAALGPCLLNVHHIGSTAIPGIRAKPVLDLMPVMRSLAELDRRRREIEARGYEWRGEHGLPGRRYCTKTDPETGCRLIQLHCYAEGSPEITRHLAFRDYLREHPEVAQAYDREKARCQTLYPDDSHAYADCKDAWIKKVEAEALARYSGE